MTVGSVVAAVLAGAAVWMLVARRPAAPVVAGSATARRALVRRWQAGFLPTAVATGASLLVLPGRFVVLGVVLAGAGVGGWWLLEQRRIHRVAARRADQVQQFCSLVAGDLEAGATPGSALRIAAAEFEDYQPVARAAELGADVPAALRTAAHTAGMSELNLIAAGWQVAHASGNSLARTLRQVERTIRQRRRTARLVEAELAAARATSKIMAGLPLLLLTAGAGLGGDPVEFLIGSPVGLGCLVTGLSLTLAGLAWLDRIAAQVES